MQNARRSHSFAYNYAFVALLAFAVVLVPLPGRVTVAQTQANAFDPIAPLQTTPAFIDDSFKPVIGGSGGISSPVNRTIVLSNGKILVAGNFQNVNGVSRNDIVRLNSDGTLDTTFNQKSGANGAISALALQSDGKIIIGGSFTMYAGQPVGEIARLDADGNFDSSFNSGGILSSAGASSSITEISVLSDDRMYIGGNFTTYNGTAAVRLARINANGTLDTTFAVTTGLDSSPSAIAQTSDGKILISGFFSKYNGTTVPRFARINSDGSLDTTFAIGTGPVGGPGVIKVLPDNTILVGGGGATFNGVARNAIVHLNADGSVDTTFNANLVGSSVTAIGRQSDGKLTISGTFTTISGTARTNVARIGADGALDSTFDPGTGINSGARFVALQSDGKAILAGTFTSYNGTGRMSLARVNADGSLDNGMNPTITSKGDLIAAARQPDGKILIGGVFASINGSPLTNIARLNADGSIDTAFNPGTGADNQMSSFAIQQDGKILISGEFTHYNGTAVNRIARLNADGSLDASFNVGTGLDAGANSLAIQSDGKVLIGGTFGTYNNVTVNHFARLNTDGSLDTGFNIGTSAANTVFKIAIQSDGKIIIGGDFNTFNGVAKGRFNRLNLDGTSDASFNPGGAGFTGRVTDIAIQADGKIVVVGGFPNYNGITRTRAARLNSDGTLDMGFDPGVGFPSEVDAVCPLPDGKYMVAGVFTTASGIPKNHIARLRSDGSLDTKFLTGLGPTGSGTALRFIVPNNGRYLVGGTFDTFNTSARADIVSISNATKANVDYDGDGKSDYAIAREYGGTGPWTYWIKGSSKGTIVSFDFGIFTVDGLQPGDYDGDGMTDVAVFRGRSAAGAPTGYWIILSSTNQVKFIPWGQDGDIPMVEDYDGDGKDDMSVWRVSPDTVGPATWFYQGSLSNPNGNITYVPFGMRYGTQGDQVDKAVPGDFDGDGKADFRVRRRADINVVTSSTPGIQYTLTAKGNLTADFWGWASDRAVLGDFDGDGKADTAVARGFNIGVVPIVWYLRYTGGASDTQFQWGSGGLDLFVSGDYDGDGITDVAVYRRADENNYYIIKSSDQTLSVVHWGTDDPLGGPASDIPIEAYYAR